MLACHLTTEEEKILITEWKYEGEYFVYNAEPYEEQKKKGFGFANPQNHFYRRSHSNSPDDICA